MRHQFRSENYNHEFDDVTGYHAYWGKTVEENPLWCEYGPAILDLEISSGFCKASCEFCYKSNGVQHSQVENMSFDLFKSILDKMDRRILTQIAFGICDIDSNPDMWKMFSYCRINDIIPNYTCNGLDITEEIAEKTKKYCGAVAVSLVEQESSFNAIKKFTDAGMTQVNIHYLLAKETFDRAFEIMDCIVADPRLAKLNAIVFLQYKPKGNGKGSFHPVADVESYKKILDYAKERNIRIGFDSCSAPLYLKTLAKYNPDKYLIFSTYADPCESGLFSFYGNHKGEFFPCSFAEGEGEWKEGLKVDTYDTFLALWQDEKLCQWRAALICSSWNCKCYANKDCRSCMLFPEITGCKKRGSK
jgi:hypothetical protein